MVVTFDAVANATAPSVGASAADLTFSHTCGASATLLIVGAAVSDFDTGVVATATYNGLPMTSLIGPIHSNNSTYGYVQVFYLTNPPTGAAHDVVVSKSGGSTWTIASAVSYAGAGTPTAATSAFGNGTPIANSVTIATGELGVQVGVSGASITANSHTLRYSRNLNTFAEASNIAYQETSSTGAPVALTLTNTSDWWAGVAFVIPIPATVATTPAWLGWFTPFGLAKSWFDTDMSLEGWGDEEDIVEPVAGGLSAPATVAETATITAAGVMAASQSATVTETVTITAAGVVARSTSATVTETATLTASGALGKSADATVAETAVVTAAGQVATLAAATVSETVTITAAGSVTSGVTASATVTQTATITATGVVGRSATATITETVTLTGAGTLGKVATATVTQTVTLTADGVVAVTSDAPVAQTVTITTTGTVDTSTGAVVAQTVTVTAAGLVEEVNPPTIVPARILAATAWVPGVEATARTTVIEGTARTAHLTATASTAVINAQARTIHITATAR